MVDYMRDASAIARRMRTFAEQNMAHWQLGFPEQLVLMSLVSHGKSNQEAIAENLRIDCGAITKTIAKLESKGLVAREVNPLNKREKFVELLPHAQEAIAEMRKNFELWEDLAFAGIPSEDLEIALRVMAKIALNIEEGKE